MIYIVFILQHEHRRTIIIWIPTIELLYAK